MQMVRSARAMALKYVDAVDGAAAPSRVPTALIEEVRRMLAQAFFFCTTAEETTEEAALRTEGLPRAGEQRLMRELKLIDAVFEVAYAAVRRGWLEAVKTVKNPLNGVTQLALRVLHRACVENGRNEYYLASRQEAGDTILAHLTELIPCKVGAVRLVNALLHDNRYLSEHLVDAHKINNFVSEEEHSALESYVVAHVADESPKWIPNGTCWVLQQAARAGDTGGHHGGGGGGAGGGHRRRVVVATVV